MLRTELDAYGRSKEFTAFVCDPARNPIAQVDGITNFDIKYKFNDISTIDFEVSRYIDNGSRENVAYLYLHSFCEIYVPELGKKAYLLIHEEPSVAAEGTMNEKKTFTAQTYESVLMYEHLVLFDINQGTETSREVWEETEGESVFLEPVKLFYPQNEKLSLLHLVLQDDYYGWTIGHVDNSLALLERSFSVDNQNVYSFLREDVCKAFRCIIDFDTANKTISVYDIETVGSQSNIYLGFENFVNLVNVQPSTADIYTVFNVAGADDLNINDINFGNSKIINISYPLSLCNPSLGYKYAQYEAQKDALRNDYSQLAIEHAQLLEEYASVMDRQPADTLSTNWSSPLITLDELKDELKYDRWYVAEIENEYRDEHGVIDWDALNISGDASTYYSFKDVAIPDLMAEIAAREAGQPYTAEKVKQEYVWNIWGVNDLIAEQSKLRESIQIYKDGGFDDPTWDPDKKIDRQSYLVQHQAYLDLVAKKTELDTILTDRILAARRIKERIEAYQDQMAEVGERASLDYFTGVGKLFSEQEAAIIRGMYRESDYNDANYLITKFDDEVSTIAVEHELYDAAEKRLAIESRPQITWSVSTADLFNIEEFKPLRNTLEVGDFIILGFRKDEIIPVANATFRTTKDGIVVVADKNNPVALRERDYIKLRCVEFDFSGLKTNTDFTITFSTMTSSKYQNNDFESLLGDYITSRTNSISTRATAAATATASRAAASLLRPYIQILNAQIDEATIRSANIDELKGVWGHFETLLVDYLTVAQAEIEYANIDFANVSMIASRDLDEHGNPTSWWNLDTGELCLGGYILRVVTEYTKSTSSVNPPDDSYVWTETMPTRTSGEYIWQRFVMIDGGGARHPSTPVCVEGVPGEKGDDGEPASNVTALSSRGTVFRNESQTTDIDVTIRRGDLVIQDITALREVYGSDARIIWKIRQAGDAQYTPIPDNDPRLSNNGFRFTMSPLDIIKAVTVVYEVWGN